MSGDSDKLFQMAAEIGTLKGLLEGQGIDIKDMKKTKAEMWKQIRWANSKINMAIGGWTVFIIIAGYLFKIFSE